MGYLLTSTSDILTTSGGDRILVSAISASAVVGFQYTELWTRLQADGGVRLGFLGVPVSIRRVRRLGGEHRLTMSIARDHRLAAQLVRRSVIREVISADGTNWREWIVEVVRKGTLDEVLIALECVSPLQALLNYPVSTSDGDGFVYSETGAVQLTPAAIAATFLRSNTPAWVAAGTVTPTELVDVGFSGDNALSGWRKLEEVTGYEKDLRRNGTTQYLMDLIRVGASAPALYLRPGKNLRALLREESADMVTRVNTILGAASDNGPSGIGSAYWEVVSRSVNDVVLGAIHGGAGPIGFDDQLVGTYWERPDLTRTLVTASVAATQTITVADGTGITALDWGRFTADSAGTQLTFLEHPTAAAAFGVVAGRYETEWDDTVIVNRNATMKDWTTPTARPDGYGGSGGTLLQMTTQGTETLTAGQALRIVLSGVADGTVILSTPSRTWPVKDRTSVWFAASWVRLLALTSGAFGLRLKVGGAVVGAPISYRTPLNVWRQLQLSGLDLSAHVGTSPTVVVELITVGTTSGTIIADSLWCGPAQGVRAVLEGNGGSRIWQGINAFLAERAMSQPASHRVGLLDLAALGVAGQPDVVLGQTVNVRAESALVPDFTTRIVELDENPLAPAETQVVIAEETRRLTKTGPVALSVPYLDPIHLTTTSRDNAQAAMKILAEITASDATTVTVLLEVLDTLGGSPTISYEAFGTTYVSGSGVGPYVFNRPASGAGQGRVLFTAALAGRESVWDAVDVIEMASPAGANTEYAECVPQITGVTATTITVTVTALTTGGTPEVRLKAITGSATLSSGPAIDVDSASGTVWVFNRGAFEAGMGQVKFEAFQTGYESDFDFVDIAEQGRDTVGLLVRARQTAQTGTQQTIRVAVADPYPQGADSASIAYVASGVGTITPASPQTVTPAATLTEAASTYKDFVVDRPAYLQPTGRVTFTVTAANRVGDTDAVEVLAQVRDTITAKATVVSSGPTSYVIRVSGASLATAVATVDWVSNLTPTPASGGTLNLMTDITATPAAGEFIDYTITRPAWGTGTGRVQFLLTATGYVSATVAVEVPAVEQDTKYSECQVSISGVTTTSITVTVIGLATSGTPQVKLVAVTGSAVQTAGAAIGTLVASGSTWTFDRGAFESGMGQTQFRAVTAGHVDDDDFAYIAEIGRDTVGLLTRVRVTGSDKTTVIVRVSVADPYPQGAGSATITYQKFDATLPVTPASGGTVTPEATLTEAAGTYIDYTITRPVYGLGDGQVVFTVTAANRVGDSDAVDVPVQVLPYTGCVVTVVSSTATTMTVSVVGSAPTGFSTPTVQLVGYTGSATANSGLGVGVPGASPQTYVINRGAAGGGAGAGRWKAVLSGAVDDEDILTVPEQASADTEYAQCTAAVTSSTATTITVSVSAAATSLGTPTVELVGYTGSATANSGLGVGVPGASPQTYVINRGAAGGGAGAGQYRAVLSGVQPDDDVVLVPAQSTTDTGPGDGPIFSIQGKADTTNPTTQWVLTWTATGTVTVSKNGAAFGTPAAAGLTSGVAFNRPAYASPDDVYVFKIDRGGQTITDTQLVPSVVVLPLVLTLNKAVGDDPTAGDVSFSWSSSGFPTGTTYDITWTLMDSASVIYSSDSALNVTSPYVAVTSGFVTGDQFDFMVIASDANGKTLKTAARSGVALG